MQALRDPIHRTIPLAPWAIDLVDSREMQRLRRIRQLGTAYLVYPGANHTRFEHGLGAYKLARDAAHAFGLDPDASRIVQAGSLLHDVGHGPLSHLFEEAVGEAHHHEAYGADLIRWSGLADRLRGHGIDPDAVAELLLGQGPYAPLVSGDIDVDRMDYLVRDAHYTGLRVSVDPERLLATLELHQGRLVVREEGVTAVEALLLARFLMYPAVYFHHTCRAGEAMLVAAVRRLLAEGETVPALRDLDDAGLLDRLGQAGGFPRDVAERIQERRLYKRVFEGTRTHVDADAYLRRLRDDPEVRARAEQELADEAGLAAGELLIDAPRPPLMTEVEARVLQKDGSIVPLQRVSTLVRHLLDAQLDHWRFWVFAPKESVDAAARAFARRLEPKSVKANPGLGPPA